MYHPNSSVFGFIPPEEAFFFPASFWEYVTGKTWDVFYDILKRRTFFHLECHMVLLKWSCVHRTTLAAILPQKLVEREKVCYKQKLRIFVFRKEYLNLYILRSNLTAVGQWMKSGRWLTSERALKAEMTAIISFKHRFASHLDCN